MVPYKVDAPRTSVVGSEATRVVHFLLESQFSNEFSGFVVGLSPISGSGTVDRTNKRRLSIEIRIAEDDLSGSWQPLNDKGHDQSNKVHVEESWELGVELRTGDSIHEVR